MEQKEKNSEISNPLLIDKIVKKVVVHLGPRELKVTRLVCNFWRKEAAKQLLQSSYIYPTLTVQKKETAADFTNFISLTGSLPLKLKYDNGFELPLVLKAVPTLASRVQELKYVTTRPIKAKEFAQLLAKFPNLKVLDTNFLNLSSSSYSRDSDLNSLLDKLKSLQEIRLNTPIGKYFHPNLLTHAEKLKAVSTMSIDDDKYGNVESFLASDRFDWNLINLTINVTEPIDLMLTRTFFVKIAKSLRTMSVDGSEKNTLALLLTSLRVLHLKKLTMNCVPEDLNERIEEWKNHPKADKEGKKLQALTLEQVELNQPCPESSSIILNVTLWPNIKCLKIHAIPTSVLSPLLFSYWDGLERLELDLRTLRFKDFGDYDKWITNGVKCPFNYKHALVLVEPRKIGIHPPQKLADLKNLKSLTIRGPEGQNAFLRDFLIYNSLKFMKHLQSLHLSGKDEGITKIKDFSRNRSGSKVGRLGRTTNFEWKILTTVLVLKHIIATRKKEKDTSK